MNPAEDFHKLVEEYPEGLIHFKQKAMQSNTNKVYVNLCPKGILK